VAPSAGAGSHAAHGLIDRVIPSWTTALATASGASVGGRSGEPTPTFQ
jgi:hypothetical protein